MCPEKFMKLIFLHDSGTNKFLGVDFSETSAT